ncbi:hypothetical protein CWI38_0390p0020 [Hamiltosporidium tvaerminnensis]|uniref:Uncharacterized protein n=1 Tax=Hamiltosporidium tvaerminnensis TaxID=1176355 RepID=A0A4Q9M051_9MICR|nr:hypothetical protein LUQ84_000258 [Hamiltosporidium tvaerminnensis]TBU04976.1 hypothetical protein CWI37_0065p0030 [Hamiltosporidium tvaerminnensis]TBU13571.1 hypothetical protein CWI38_0390p0020 [Hamiltosporidium tvaerminnensis]
MISHCLPNDKMTLDTYYTILYFLEYLRVKYNDKLREVLRLCFVNLSISIVTDDFDIETVSFHFSKQEYFSHQLFKKLSQEYFKFSKFKINMIDPFFPKKNIL